MGETPARHRGLDRRLLAGGRRHGAVHRLAQCLVARPTGRALAEERLLRGRERDAVEARRLALVEQEGQKLFDGARVAVAASDWSQARLQLEKALTTIGDEASLESLKGSAQTLLGQVERELRGEANRKGAQARFQQFVKLRNEAQFLGTLYTGMDLAPDLAAARLGPASPGRLRRLERSERAARTRRRPQSDTQKAEVLGDCYQLLLVLAETEAQSTSDAKPAEKESLLGRALGYLDHAQTFGTPSRAFHLRRARYLKMLGKTSDANQAERAAGKASLDNVLDHFLMADEFYRREQFLEAIREFDRVLARNPSHFWAEYLNALCLLRQQRPAEARALLSACLAQRTDFVWLYLLRGFAQEELQAWDEADSDFQQAAQLPLDENTRYVLLVYRAVLRIRTDRFADAIADLQAAIEIKPNAYQALVNMANAYRRLGNRDQAVAQLDRAIELEPGLGPSLPAASPASARTQPAGASASSTSIRPSSVKRRTVPTRSTTSSTAAVSCCATRNTPRRSRRSMPRWRCARIIPRRCGCRRRRCFIWAASKRLSRRSTATWRPGSRSESVYRGRGLARAELGRYAGAIEDFTKALEMGPTSAVQAYRGWMHLGVDAPKLAQRDFELAIELDPKNGDAYSGRGMVHASQGRYREATRDAAEAVRLGPPSPRLFFNAARIYAQCPDPSPQRAAGADPAGHAFASRRSTVGVLVQEYSQGPGPRGVASTPCFHPDGNRAVAEELTDAVELATYAQRLWITALHERSQDSRTTSSHASAWELGFGTLCVPADFPYRTVAHPLHSVTADFPRSSVGTRT